MDLTSVLNCVGDVEVVTTNVDLTGTEYFGTKPFTEPIKLTATATNRAGVVSLNCDYRFVLNLVCDRCLAPVIKEQQLTFTHTVVRETANEDSDDNYLIVPNALVDLDELAAEDLIPELPTKVLCQEDCKGLCQRCGKNLNDGPCSCKQETHDSRWDVLDSLK